ncbi:sugar ABC transporter permease [Sporolactobacillus vineae]|uniref:sugar ABC transporter permease n=1 Tax=Sporolactobacillus vineae TaxID=444463 RepID=UPI000288A73C|nr:sugar ABC transporter permease [Sporolactobacillus vineae]
MDNKINKKAIRKAGILSIIPGLGQFYNKQPLKGIIFMSINILFIIELLTFGISSIQNFLTLGTVPIRDNSMFFLVEGTLQIIILFIYLVVWILNIIDARKTARVYLLDGSRKSSSITILKNVWQKGFPYILTIPAYIVMLFVIVFPVLVTLFMAFTNYDFFHTPPAHLIDWTGLSNFFSLIFLSAYRSTFISVLWWTLVWAIVASTLQIILGILTAVIVNQDFVKGKRFFRTIFLLPWAVPAFITIMSFSNIFNDSMGAINIQVISLINYLLPFIHIPMIPWKTNPFWTKTALIMIQTWLGFPFIFVIVTGVLQSIPNELYEAAKMDGANFWQRFTKITLPMILFATTPVMITQYTGNFNNFNIIYLFNAGGPGDVGGGAGTTDILISWIYKLTVGDSPQFGMASAVTIIISIIVVGVSLAVFKKAHTFDSEEMM